MKKVLFMALAAFFTLSAAAQDLKKGIYYVSPDGLQFIEKLNATPSMTGGFGIGNVTISGPTKYSYKGTNAEVKTTTTPEFLFVYSEKPSGVMANGDVFGFKHTINPNLAVLVHLAIEKNKKRVLDNFSYGTQVLDTLLVEPVNDHVFKVRLAQPLTPGEYGFMFRWKDDPKCMPAVEYLWDFSVQPE